VLVYPNYYFVTYSAGNSGCILPGDQLLRGLMLVEEPLLGPGGPEGRPRHLTSTRLLLGLQ